MRPFSLGGPIGLQDLEDVAHGRRLLLPPGARRRMASSRRVVDRLVRGADPIYSLNTGFGPLVRERIAHADLCLLQENIIRSHACGVGAPLDFETSRSVLFLRANELARGCSGVRPEVAETMHRLLEAGAAPFIPSRGSVGASGDLAPLAHMGLLLLGEGEAWLGRPGRPAARTSASRALAAARLKPLRLAPKEGLALINGTQVMQAVGGLALVRSLRLLAAANRAAALSVEALKGSPGPFDPALHRLKPHPGQRRSAASLWRDLEGSEIRESHRRDDPRVQDPYSLRCAPQVHGACADNLEHARRVAETEMNSATDNPLLVGGTLVSGGNFHGQSIAMALDIAALALTVLGGISERRIFQLVWDASGVLPSFLTRRAGVESGWMIPQYAAAALASENKVLSHPASADSIPTSGNKEDYVSMGMAAALKLAQVVQNAAGIVAVELLAAAQGVEFHAPLKPGAGAARTLAWVRRLVRRPEGDRELSGPIRAVSEALLSPAASKELVSEAGRPA